MRPLITNASFNLMQYSILQQSGKIQFSTLRNFKIKNERVF